MAACRATLQEVRTHLAPLLPESERWSAPNSFERFVQDWNDRRLAAVDVEAIIRSPRRVTAAKTG